MSAIYQHGSPNFTVSSQSRRSPFEMGWKETSGTSERQQYRVGRRQCEVMGGYTILASSALCLCLLWGNLQNALFPSARLCNWLGRESAEMRFLSLVFDLLSFQVQPATAFTYPNLVACTHSHMLVLSCHFYTCSPQYRHH